MIRRTKFLAAAVIVTAASGVTAASLAAFTGFFQSAPAGVSVPVTHVPLPPVVWQPGQVIPPTIANTNGLIPGVNDLVQGHIVITNERAMRFVWNRLFAVPYDTSLFDFQNTFVVLVGAGSMDIGTFDISSVETVDATYADTFPGSSIERFLSVTSTITFPGQPPPFPPPPHYAVDAVKVPITEFDDAVFHQNFVALP